MSVGLHGVLLYSLRSRPPRISPRYSPPIEIVEAPASPKRERSLARAGNKGKGAAPAPSLSDLTRLEPLDGTTQSAPARSAKDGKGSGLAEGTELDTGTIARSLAYEDEVRSDPWLQAIWRRIDDAVDYPAIFAEQRIEGNVHFQLDLDGNGIRKSGIHRLSSDHRYLRAYVVAAVTRALAEPLEKRHRLPKGMALSLHFEFKTSPDPGSANRHRGEVRKNQLRFTRLAFTRPEWEKAYDKFMTRYFPPILILPGGFFVDFVRLYRMIDEWGEADPDDIAARQLELLHSVWKQNVAGASHRR